VTLACLLLVWAAAGCRTLSFPANAARDPKDPKAGLPQGVTGAGWHIVWHAVNPLRRAAAPWTVLDATARSGQMSDEENDDRVTLEKVTAVLYRHGKPAAIVTAPEITASQNGHSVLATGGATLPSVADPPDVVVTGQNLRWDSKSSSVVATGNAKVVRRPRPHVTPFVQTGEHVTFDTRLKQFTVE